MAVLVYAVIRRVVEAQVIAAFEKLEPISKMRLRPHGGVAGRLKMLTYCRVCCAFSPPRVLPLKPDSHL